MTKERLRAYRSSALEHKQLREQLEALEARIYTPKAQRLSAMPRGPAGDGHAMDDLAILHIKLQDLYREQLVGLEREQLEIETALRILEPAQRMVIRYRYLDLLSWENVAERMHYGWSQTHRIHAAALQRLEEADHGKD